MSNISIYLNPDLQNKLDVLTKEGLADERMGDLPENIGERSRSALIATIIEQEYQKMIKSQMIADAAIVDQQELGWTQEEERCQSTY